MSLIVYNGSPRGKKSNSSIITNWFMEGYGNNDIEIRYLSKISEHKNYVFEASNYDQILMVFPLYVDGMPGQVKSFFESLYEIKEKLKNREITFVIHSGFSDGIQNRILEQYLNRFTSIMNMNNKGIIIAPGSEGFRHMPASMTKKKRLAMSRLGYSYKNKEDYNEKDLKFLFGKETSSKLGLFVYKILSFLGVTNIWWNSQLKKNNAFKNRFDAPYKDNLVKITTNAAISIRNTD